MILQIIRSRGLRRLICVSLLGPWAAAAFGQIPANILPVTQATGQVGQTSPGATRLAPGSSLPVPNLRPSAFSGPLSAPSSKTAPQIAVARPATAELPRPR
jgi:hypothetical protein